MSQLSTLHRTVICRALLVVAAFSLSACLQRAAPTNVGKPLPAPGTVQPQPGYPQPPAHQVQQPPIGAQDAVLRGVAYLSSGGNAQVPPGSQLTVRVYDAQGDVNQPVAEKTFTSNGQGLPWSYEMRVPYQAVKSLSSAAVAGRIVGPDGRLLYLNDQKADLREGGSDDIPMVAASGAFSSNAPIPQHPLGTPPIPSPAYQDYQLTPAPSATPTYGVPDYNQGYGLQRYDQPVYQGQTYGSTTLSAPPSNRTY